MWGGATDAAEGAGMGAVARMHMHGAHADSSPSDIAYHIAGCKTPSRGAIRGILRPIPAFMQRGCPRADWWTAHATEEIP